jgi:hypothetical protein
MPYNGPTPVHVMLPIVYCIKLNADWNSTLLIITVRYDIMNQIIIILLITLFSYFSALTSAFSFASNLVMSFNNVSEYRFIWTLRWITFVDFFGGIVWNVVLKKEDIIIYPLFPFASSFLSSMRAVVQKEGSRQVFQEWRHVSFGVTASAF